AVRRRYGLVPALREVEDGEARVPEDDTRSVAPRAAIVRPAMSQQRDSLFGLRAYAILVGVRRPRAGDATHSENPDCLIGCKSAVTSVAGEVRRRAGRKRDRKSTRLNSSHV